MSLASAGDGIDLVEQDRWLLRQCKSRADPLRTAIGIGRILEPVLAKSVQKNPDFFPPRPKERPQQPVAAMEKHGLSHTGESGGIGFARPVRPHRHRLDLIIKRVAGEDGGCPNLIRRLAEQAIARLAGRGRNTGGGLVSEPPLRRMRDAKSLADAAHLSRLLRRCLPQAVVDGHRKERDAFMWMAGQGEQETE
jgi:hypothetical protein